MFDLTDLIFCTLLTILATSLVWIVVGLRTFTENYKEWGELTTQALAQGDKQRSIIDDQQALIREFPRRLESMKELSNEVGGLGERQRCLDITKSYIDGCSCRTAEDIAHLIETRSLP